MSQHPRITVLMSVYNGKKYLREAIDSILGQTYGGFEFVIYDDCSTDASSEIIQSYHDERIDFRKNECNQGLTKNLADGIDRANGEFVARMDADDIANPYRLEAQLSWLDAHPDIAILGAQVMYFDAKGDIGVTHEPQDNEAIKISLMSSFTLLHPTIMMRVSDLRRNGLNYNPKYRYSQDHALYFDCMLKGLKFANHPEPLLKMRSHGGSISKSKHDLQKECSNRARAKILETLGLVGVISKEEKDAYDAVANGELPSSATSLWAFDSFVDKLCGGSGVGNVVDQERLRLAFARKLWALVYANAREPRWRGVRKLYWNTNMAKLQLPHISLRMMMKYYAKSVLSYFGC